MTMFRLSFLCSFFLALLVLPLSLFAKSIDLYETPDSKAKVLGTLDSKVGIIPIFTPDKSEWIKVADPRNGNVGWVKMKDLSSENGEAFTFSQRFIGSGSAPQTYQIIQFGTPNKMTSEQIQEELKKSKKQQQEIQENMNKAMQNMINNMNKFYQETNTPFIMPVIIMPAPQVAPTKSKDNTPATTTKTEKH